MRTRFLPIDYFGSPSSSTSYFSLPVPRLPPPPCLSSKRFLLFDLLPITDVHLDINNLKIEIALVKLLTDVIPHKIDVPGENFEPAFSSDEKDIANHGVESETEVIHGVKGATESYRSHELAAPEDRRSRHESKQCIVDKSVELTELVHFEIPELDVHLEGLHAFGIEHADIFSGFPPIENDMVGIKQVLEMHNNHEIEESVYSFEYIKLENLMEPQADLVEDECCVQGSSNFHLPLLEVNNISSGNFVFMSMEDDIATLFTKIEGQLLTQKEDFTIADEHILNFMECALLKSPSHDSPAIQCSETDLSSAEIFLDIDFINIGGILSPQENLSSYQGMQGGNQFLSLNPVVLEEFQTLEIGLAPIFDFFHSGKFHEHDPCKEMLKDGVIWKSLDDLVINHELALVDDMFRSLPIPVLPDKKAMELLHDITGKVYIGLELRPLSASDDIYLDWNLLEEDKCSSATFSFFLYMIRTIDFLSINFDWRTSSISEIVLDFVLSDFGSDELSVDESHKSTDIACSPGSVLNGHEEVASTESQFGHQVHTTHKRLPEDNFRRTSSVFNSMSPFNDLDFFLNPSKSGTDKKDTKPIMDSNGITEKVQSINSMEVHESPVRQFQKKDFILHQVHLSDDLIAITVNMERIYLDILERNAELKSLHCSFQEVDAFRLLSISKLVFIDCIKNLGRQKPLLRARGEMIITCSTLCAIKQIAWYLCFYGISTAQSYLDKLCEGFDFFASRLSAFQKFLMDNNGQPGMVKASSHPSLLFIQDILISSTNQNGFKALVVADKVFCSALKLLLTSLGISFTQLNEFTKYPIRGLSDHVDFSNQNTEFLQEKVCFLAYPE
ncbi:hypothetical protein SAY86_023503 [Trapa natans]|uniref:Uncharacterized protein n=1 Tax=Trapa natans TaxID=22666 RepID=A0AAN7RBK5_TRANT|nr:hypothetical protein SAY86_023503 [Trapa natans]